MKGIETGAGRLNKAVPPLNDEGRDAGPPAREEGRWVVMVAGVAAVVHRPAAAGVADGSAMSYWTRLGVPAPPLV